MNGREERVIGTKEPMRGKMDDSGFRGKLPEDVAGGVRADIKPGVRDNLCDLSDLAGDFRRVGIGIPNTRDSWCGLGVRSHKAKMLALGE